MSTRGSLAPKKLPGRSPRHRCFELADEKLKDKNTELVEKWEFPSGRARLTIATRKINSRLKGEPLVIVASFCPFCGEELHAAQK